jgi:hypothetical protein
VRRAGQAGSAVGNRQDHCELCAVERDEARNWHEASRNEKGQDGGFVQIFFPFSVFITVLLQGPLWGIPARSRRLSENYLFYYSFRLDGEIVVEA